MIIVDDDVMILRLCGLIMDSHKIPYGTYNDPVKLSTETPDPEVSHLLIDIRMPAMNGVELCHILRKNYDPTTTFVALTAHVLPQEQQQLLEEGFDIVLPKPFREHDLLSLFDNVSREVSNAASESDEIDLTTLKRMTQGDDALLQSILAQFIDETENDLIKLDENCSLMNTRAVREIVHKLAGRIGQFGALSLSAKLRAIESALMNGEDLAPQTENITRPDLKLKVF